MELELSAGTTSYDMVVAAAPLETDSYAVEQDNEGERKLGIEEHKQESNSKFESSFDEIPNAELQISFDEIPNEGAAADSTLGATASKRCKRYAEEWVCQKRLGFASVCADAHKLTLSFYAVTHNAQKSYVCVHSVAMARK
jgi:hypothetical protein